MAENKADGKVVITLSGNDVEAVADFFPPIGRGMPITGFYIESLLEEFNIVYGIRREAIQEAVERCNRERRPIKGVVIARGEPPVNEVTEYFEINPHINTPPRPPEGPGEKRVDYRGYSPFIVVKQNQILASLRPHKTGKNGKNVHGQEAPFSVIRPDGVQGGDNTRIDGEAIFAAINGQFVQKGDRISVQESLVINGPVGYATGNIIFPGDVVIDGPVSDGFKIVSGGSVTIKQTFDVTSVIAKGDLFVAGGIIGRGTALVKIEGGIRTKFIENCRAACRKNVIVDSEVTNSTIYTMGSLNLGDKGTLIGSEIYAMQGVRAGNIGKGIGKSTHIHCGVDFTVQQEIEKHNNQFRILAAKQDRLREIIARADADEEKKAKMEELSRRLYDEQKKTAARITELLARLNAYGNAVVEVSGEICPGTLIEICQAALFVDEPLRKVRIRLDAATGKLISSPLGGKNS